MKHKTPGGTEYEVPQREDLFSEAPSQRPVHTGLVRVIERLEDLLEDTEANLANCHDQRHYVSAELADAQRRLVSAEAKIDALALNVTPLDVPQKGQWP